jgi:ABC-type phosphate/phosphonate transport system ATPase subunit
VTGDLLAEKEAIITNLINEIEQHKQALINSSGFAEEINTLRQEKSALENVIAGQKGKLSHMDTLLKQLSDTEKKLAESEEALQLYLKPKKSKKISKVSINTENDF